MFNQIVVIHIYIPLQSILTKNRVKTGKISPNDREIIRLHLGRNIIRQLIVILQALGLNVCPHNCYEGKQNKKLFLHCVYSLILQIPLPAWKRLD